MFGEKGKGVLSFDTATGDISSAQVDAILARLSALDQENDSLKAALQSLQSGHNDQVKLPPAKR